MQQVGGIEASLSNHPQRSRRSDEVLLADGAAAQM